MGLWVVTWGSNGELEAERLDRFEVNKTGIVTVHTEDLVILHAAGQFDIMTDEEVTQIVSDHLNQLKDPAEDPDAG